MREALPPQTVTTLFPPTLLSFFVARTRCYSAARDTYATSSSAGALLVHEDDLHCLPRGSVVCGPSDAVAIKCYAPDAIAAGTTPGCTSKFYACAAGVPSQVLDVALGTACYNGSIVLSSNPVCAPRPNATGVGNSVNASSCQCGVTLQLSMAGVPADMVRSSIEPGGNAEHNYISVTFSCSSRAILWPQVPSRSQYHSALVAAAEALKQETRPLSLQLQSRSSTYQTLVFKLSLQKE